MSQFYNVKTNAGDAAIANAIATNTKLNITHVAFGDGNGAVPTPDKLRTTLVNEVHRQAVTKYTQHPTVTKWITVETIIPAATGGFWIREIGIIADGIMITHGSHAPFFKVADTEGVSEYRLKFTIDIQDASIVQLALDQSLIFATQAWVNEASILRTDIVDNLTTNDSTKPLSAAQGKELNDNKLGKLENAASATKLQNARKINGTNFDGSSDIKLALDIQRFTTNGSFTVPDGVTKIYISACGGGGGGGGSKNTISANAGGGGGGGAGQYVIREPYTVEPNAIIPITIGGAGAGGIVGGNGQNGGNTIIGQLLTLSGGGGGFSGGPSVNTSSYGGAGGDGYPAGGAGVDAQSTNGGGASSGKGASTPFGTGGSSVKGNGGNSNYGRNAVGYGSGGSGSGGVNGNVTANGGTGGNGAPGIVIIEW